MPPLARQDLLVYSPIARRCGPCGRKRGNLCGSGGRLPEIESEEEK